MQFGKNSIKSIQLFEYLVNYTSLLFILGSKNSLKSLATS